MALSTTPQFIFLVIISIALLSGNNMVSGHCQGDVQGLMEQCARYVQRSSPITEPSQGCCGVVKMVDLACVCHHITDEVEHIISMEKAAYIAQFCGKPLSRGTKCGSYTVA